MQINEARKRERENECLMCVWLTERQQDIDSACVCVFMRLRKMVKSFDPPPLSTLSLSSRRLGPPPAPRRLGRGGLGLGGRGRSERGREDGVSEGVVEEEVLIYTHIIYIYIVSASALARERDGERR